MIPLRRTLVVLAAALTLWALIVALFDGIVIGIGSLSVSSHDPRNPAIAALAIAVLVILASRRLGGVSTIPDDWTRVAGSGRVASAGIMRSLRALLRHTATRVPEVIAIAAALIYTAAWLTREPLWVDEEMIALNFRDRSFVELPGLLWLGQSAPVGWLVAQRLALLTFGTGEAALRAIPVLFGLATIVTALWIGRRWLTGAGAAVLVLLSAFGLWVAHYPFEVKHYSADVFWALLLPALAIRAADTGDERTRILRTGSWWLVAVAAQWLSNGGLFVAPGCAIVLCALAWRRHGRRSAVITAALGLPWLLSLILYFDLSILPMMRDGFLHDFWVDDLPPHDLNVAQVAGWIVARLDELASNPAGSQWPVALWLVAAAGCLFGTQRRLGAIFFTAPPSMFLLSGAGIVPLHERFALWMVPALYVGIALAFDRLIRRAATAAGTQSWAGIALAGAIATIPLAVAADVVARGYGALTAPRGEEKHLLDDRASVRWLISQQRPGDVLATTRLGWPAIWWYAGYSIGGDAPAGWAKSALVLQHRRIDDGCDPAAFRATLSGYSRVLVYIGFPDTPEGFDRMVLQQLAGVGTIVELRKFAPRSRVAVVEIGPTTRAAVSETAMNEWPDTERTDLDGCAVVRPATRWRSR